MQQYPMNTFAKSVHRVLTTEETCFIITHAFTICLYLTTKKQNLLLHLNNKIAILFTHKKNQFTAQVFSHISNHKERIEHAQHYSS
jgi:hypothetical protein